MTDKLTHIQRFRFSKKTVINLNQLKKYGICKSKFVREAIDCKLKSELPELIEKKHSPKLPF